MNINKIRLSGQTYNIQDQNAQPLLTAGQGITIENNVISATGGGSITVDTALDSGSTNPVENRVIYNKIDEVEEVTAAGLNALNDKINPTVELTQAQYDVLVSGGTVDPNTYYIITDAQASDLTNYYTKSETNTLLGGKQATLVSGTNIKTINNESILGSGNIDIQGGGSTYTAGRGIDITNDTISVSLPISAGTGTNALVYNSTTNVASGNSSHAEGSNTTASGDFSHAEGNVTTARGGQSHAEGFGTIASGNSSHAEGANTTASGGFSHAEGWFSIASGNCSHAEGFYTIAKNQSEHTSGQYNVSNKTTTTFGYRGNTLFSVGNGTAENARHNAFEVRQNGDIYITKDGQDVKLQDQLGGSSITVDTALDSGSTNPVENRVIYNKIDEVEQVTAAALNNINDRLSEDEEVTAAGLNAVNDKFDGLKLKKLSQAEYDALSPNYDSNTLYVIV